MSLIDPVGAFCPGGLFEIEGSPAGRLCGATFAAKDLFDIEGRITGCGNPAWAAEHPPATRTASVVTQLLDAGATIVGKTITDELAYSLNGDNMHYGTPRNVNAVGRVPGGSSSGSAAAVAAKLCTFALGTDTGGSVRIPASYCGIFGIRTTHGFISRDGLIPLMPSFDTVGWFANDATTMRRVGEVLLPDRSARFDLKNIVVLTDAFAEAERDAADALLQMVDQTVCVFTTARKAELANDGDGGLEQLRTLFRRISAREGWAVHGDWVSRHWSDLAPVIAERFQFARDIANTDGKSDLDKRSQIRNKIEALVADHTVLCLPSAPGIAPLLNAHGNDVELFRQRAQRLTAIAGMSGLPQISIPGVVIAGAPIGLSLIGPAGSDQSLIELSSRIESRFMPAAVA